MALDCGVMIGSYRVEALLGCGGMGEVYGVTDTSTGRRAALKTLPAGRAERRLWERFMNEAAIQAEVSHPSIAAFYEMFLWNGRPCLVMEYVPGPTLQERLAGAGPLEPPEAVRMLDSICEALSYLHARGILHRDLKPSNIKLLPDGGVKVIDFGIARFRQAGRLTQTGTVAGTPEMLAPELLQGHLADERSEIWGLGVLAYEMLTGQTPFTSGCEGDLYRQVLEVEPRRPSLLSPATPEALDRIVLRCLSKSPARRFRHCSELRRALSRVFAPAQLTAWTQSRRARWLAALALALSICYAFRGLLGPGGDAQTVTIDAVGGAAEVYEGGSRVGRTPYTRAARAGDVIRLELRREGSIPQPVEFEVSQRKAYSFNLSPARESASPR